MNQNNEENVVTAVTPVWSDVLNDLTKSGDTILNRLAPSMVRATSKTVRLAVVETTVLFELTEVGLDFALDNTWESKDDILASFAAMAAPKEEVTPVTNPS